MARRSPPDEDEIKEYLYVDERRLNSYLGQFSRLVIYERFFKWRAALGLQPSLGGELERAAREPTLHEKVTALQRKLQKNVQVLHLEELEQWGMSFLSGKPFFTLNLCARRAFIPPSSNESSQGISLWYAILPRESPIFLLEDFPCSDSRQPFTTSTYTILRILLRDIERELKNTILCEYLETPEGIDKLTQEFAKNPVENLAKLGAEVSDERNIWTLSRVRALFREGAYGPSIDQGWTVFGYPIVISEATVSVKFV
jgi:hypothetical protein